METLLQNKVENTVHETRNVTVYTNRYIALVEEIYAAENKPQGYKGTVASMLWMFFSKMSKKRNAWKRETFRALLLHLFNQGCYTVLRKVEYVEVLSNISTFGNRIVRDFHQWEKETYVAENQLKSLIAFCFAKYPVPEFLTSSFFEPQKKYMLWYVQLGVGRSVKSLSGIEVALTTKMAHEFRSTPSGYNVHQAIRRAQALGYGASKNRAEDIAWSGLSRVQGNEAFWATVVHFFARQEEVHFAIMNEIIDYLSHRVRHNHDFSMRGRSLAALMRQSEEWHRNLYMQRNAENFVSWKSSGIKSLNYQITVDSKTVNYKTIELLNSQELYEEGYDMSHCVASYVDDCYDGRSAIFSLRKYLGESYEKMATIEIDPETREIVQAQAKYNGSLSDEALKVLQIWKERSKLEDGHQSYQPQQELRPQHHGEDQMQRFANRQQDMRQMNQSDISASTVFWVVYVVIKLVWLLTRI